MNTRQLEDYEDPYFTYSHTPAAMQRPLNQEEKKELAEVISSLQYTLQAHNSQERAQRAQNLEREYKEERDRTHKELNKAKNKNIGKVAGGAIGLATTLIPPKGAMIDAVKIEGGKKIGELAVVAGYAIKEKISKKQED